MEKISIWCGFDQNMLETIFNFTLAARRKLDCAVPSLPTNKKTNNVYNCILVATRLGNSFIAQTNM